jgi:hypothetical protein
MLVFAVTVGVATSVVSFSNAPLEEAVRDSDAVIVAERAGAKWRVVEVMYFPGDPGQAQPSGTITVADAHVKPWRKDWRFAIEGGWESLAKKETIAAAIAKGGIK